MPRLVPPPERAPQLSWPTELGDAQRAAYAALTAPADSPRVVWSAGAGHGLLATPLVAPPMLFTGASNRVVMALSTQSGRPYWQRRLDGAVGTAVVARDGRIYAASGERSGAVYALEPLHGRVIWKRKLGFAAAAPLLLGDTLVVPLMDGRVVALASDRGNPLWDTHLPAPPAATAVPAAGILAVPARNDSIYALRQRDGAIVGRALVGGFASATPALAGDTLYVPLERGGLLALRLPALTPLFRTREPSAANPTGAIPTIANPAAEVLAAPVVAPGGSVYYLDVGADLWHVAPGAATATRLASLGGAADASLTLTRDGLLVGKLDGTLSLVRFDGSTAWQRRFDGSITAPAAVAGGAIYVPLERGRIVKVR